MNETLTGNYKWIFIQLIVSYNCNALGWVNFEYQFVSCILKTSECSCYLKQKLHQIWLMMSFCLKTFKLCGIWFNETWILTSEVTNIDLVWILVSNFENPSPYLFFPLFWFKIIFSSFFELSFNSSLTCRALSSCRVGSKIWMHPIIR